MKLITSLVAVAFISACTPSTQSALEKACGSESVAYIVYVGLKASGRISLSNQAKAEAAHSIATDVCANPPVDTASALQTIARALASIAGVV